MRKNVKNGMKTELADENVIRKELQQESILTTKNLHETQKTYNNNI